MKPIRVGLVILLLVIMSWSWWQVGRAAAGLEIVQFRQNGLPLRYVGPAHPVEPRPGVIIAHGFSGSQQLMLGYSLTLAHAGYATISLDFSGHGANPQPLDTSAVVLQNDLNAAYAALIAQPAVDSERIALLGHSMGSGAVMQAGIDHPERTLAVMALSPTDAPVTAAVPPNLYLQAGRLERGFLANAERLLAAAGGPRPVDADGRGRALEIIPFVEHITILFAPASHDGVRRWVNEVFGEQSGGRPAYVDRRVWWYLLFMTAGLLLVAALRPLFEPSADTAKPLKRFFWLWPLIASLSATLLLAAVNLVWPVRTLGGLLVGGGVALWFLLAGLLWLPGVGLPRPAGRDLAAGLLLFALLSLAFGALAPRVWAPWWLIPPRLVRVPLFFAAVLPLHLAAATAQQHGQPGARWRWWLILTASLTIGLFLVALLVPGMGFIALILPLLPVLLAIVTIGSYSFGSRPWAAAIGNALFFGWVLIMVFPMN